MLARAFGLEIIGGASPECQKFIILGTIQLVDIQFKSCHGRKVILSVTKTRKDYTRKHKRS